MWVDCTCTHTTCRKIERYTQIHFEHANTQLQMDAICKQSKLFTHLLFSKASACCPSLEQHPVYIYILQFRAFIRCFCPKQLTVFHIYIHTLMVLSTMQCADQHIRRSLALHIFLCSRHHLLLSEEREEGGPRPERWS